MDYSRPCPACRGMGAVPNTQTGSQQTCPVCEGSGETEPKVKRDPYDFIFPRQVIAAALGQVAVGIQTPAQFDFEWWDTVAVYSGTCDVKLEVGADTLMNTNAPGRRQRQRARHPQLGRHRAAPVFAALPLGSAQSHAAIADAD